MKLKTQILIVCALAALGCSSKLDSTYDRPHVPPPRTPAYKAPAPAAGKKVAATQRPYRIKGVKYTPIASATGFSQTGKASWYGRDFHGRKTSNGEIYDMYAMTAAHKTLPMNTWVMVHNLENGRKITVRINDRGPFVRGRIIDLTYTGAKRLGIVGPGTARVRVKALGQAVSYSRKTHVPLSFKPIDYLKGNFTVQVGAFKVRVNAEKERSRLSRFYGNAHISVFTDDRGTFYRVRVGGFKNLNEAVRFRDSLVAKGFSAFTVAE